MATAQFSTILRHLRSAVLAGGNLSDGQLLECYLARREEAAFEALVRRHGPMVLGVCRRVLGNSHDAEDAFQATFLVLVRKAAVITPRDQVGNWLHGVAYRTALKARSAAAKRRAREARIFRQEAVQSDPPHDWQALLDQELQRLPDKYRVAIVWCDLDGKTRKEAARHLGWAEGTLNTRLTRARAMLLQRLSRRGVTLSSVALAASLAQNAAAACVPTALVAATIQVQRLIGLAGVPGAIPARIALLMEGVIKAMTLIKLKKFLVMGLIALSMLGLGIGGYQTLPAEEPVPKESAATAKPPRTISSEHETRLPADPKVRHLSLSEAIAIALENGTDDSGLITCIGARDDAQQPATKCRTRVLARKSADGVHGIELAIVASELAPAEFQRQVHNLLLNTEMAYWKLYQAYGQLCSNQEALRLAHKAWQTGKASLADGGLDLKDLFPIRAQFEESRYEHLNSLGLVLEAEHHLRGIIGLRAEDGKRIVPVTAPILAAYQPNWQVALDDANALRPELILARQNLKQAQMTLVNEQNHLERDMRSAQDRPTELVPLRAHPEPAALKSARLAVDRSDTLLQDREVRVERVLAHLYQKMAELHRLIEVQQAERQAYDESLKAKWKLYKSGTGEKKQRATLTLSLLDYQRRLLFTRVKEYQAVADYNINLARFEWAKGTIMLRDNVSLSDGLPKGAQVRAVENERRRTRAQVLQVRPMPLTHPGMFAGHTVAAELPAE